MLWICSKGKKVAILSFGTVLKRCRKPADDLGATLVNMRFVKPLDEKLLEKLSQEHQYLITVEDNTVLGGAGGAVGEWVLNHKLKVKVKNIGLPDYFLPHGGQEEILNEAGLSEEGILSQIKKFIEKEV